MTTGKLIDGLFIGISIKDPSSSINMRGFLYFEPWMKRLLVDYAEDLSTI